MKTPQSEAKDIYENIIIPDLEYAINHMGDIAYGYNGNESASGRATKPAAQAIRDVYIGQRQDSRYGTTVKSTCHGIVGNSNR